MYAHICKDENCVLCRGVSKGPEEEIRVKTMDQFTEEDMVSATAKKSSCFNECRQIKDEIHSKINKLIDILKKREQTLCLQAEHECFTEMEKINHIATVRCINKALNGKTEPVDYETHSLVFKCELDYLEYELQNFGQLVHRDPMRDIQKRIAKHVQKLEYEAEMSRRIREKFDAQSALWEARFSIENNSITKNDGLNRHDIKPSMRFYSDDNLKSYRKVWGPLDEIAQDSMCSKDDEKVNSLFPTPNKSKALKGEGQCLKKVVDSRSSKEHEKDNSSEDPFDSDLEIISKYEAADIPSEWSYIPKKRFYSKRPKCFNSFFSKKGDAKALSPESSERHIPIQTCPAPLRSLVTAFRAESKRREYPFSDSVPIRIPILRESEDTEKKNVAKSISMSDPKEIPFNDEVGQKSADAVIKDSNLEISDPSEALLSTFKKYLEKKPEGGEWLAPETSCERLSEEGCISKRNAPFLLENINLWLPTKNEEKGSVITETV